MDLRDKYPLGQRAGDLTMEGVTLLGVREILDPEDLELPILLNKREDEESIVVDCGAARGDPYGCHLRGGDFLRNDVTDMY